MLLLPSRWGSRFNHSFSKRKKYLSGFLFYDFSTSDSSVWLIKVNILYLISYIICDCVSFLKNITNNDCY